jgi:hypothetical protein
MSIFYNYINMLDANHYVKKYGTWAINWDRLTTRTKASGAVQQLHGCKAFLAECVDGRPERLYVATGRWNVQVCQVYR